MESFFSIVLPVRNSELSLQNDITALMECASDARAAFEILIFDIGSLDDTFEVACELSNTYPQVQAFSMNAGTPLNTILDRARKEASSDALCVYHGNGEEFRPDIVIDLWRKQSASDQARKLNPAHDWQEQFRIWSDGRRGSRLTSSPSKGFRFEKRVDSAGQGSRGTVQEARTSSPRS